jgi:thymidylate synthase (FAD)
MKIDILDSFHTEESLGNIAAMSRGNLISKDPIKLIKMEYMRGHMSIFRSAKITFRCIDIPLFVLRQWDRHEVGQNKIEIKDIRLAEDGYNEKSMRYTKNPKLDKPDRLIKFSSEQEITELYNRIMKMYNSIIDKGGPAEVARMVLPMTTLTSFVWTVSVETLLKFFKERLADTAQLEIRNVAIELFLLFQKEYPTIARLFLDNKDNQKFKWFNGEIKYIERAI